MEDLIPLTRRHFFTLGMCFFGSFCSINMSLCSMNDTF